MGIFAAIIHTFIDITYTQTTSPTSSPTQQQQEVILDEPSTDTDTTITPNDILSESDMEDISGGGVWSSIGMIAVVICGCVCFERLYSSCKKVYMKRTGRYGFSRLHNQTFNEFDGDEEDELNKDLDEDMMNEHSLGDNITTN